jgi:hypothetical protein
MNFWDTTLATQALLQFVAACPFSNLLQPLNEHDGAAARRRGPFLPVSGTAARCVANPGLQIETWSTRTAAFKGKPPCIASFSSIALGSALVRHQRGKPGGKTEE